MHWQKENFGGSCESQTVVSGGFGERVSAAKGKEKAVDDGKGCSPTGFTTWWNKCPMPSMKRPFSVVVEKEKDAVTGRECDPQEKEKAEQEIREERTAKS